jgi:tRNA threonylcarbamoyladenosine biosynthesis protein TsaB
MALILCIETATPVCSVALAENNFLVRTRESTEKNAHSGMLTLLIQEMMKESGKQFSHLDAVAVSKGPGSYTGLRIGVSAAKGFCYALDIPLISVDTLQAMASGMSNKVTDKDSLFCPMIDARRMEVYCAMFDAENHQVRETKAEIIDKDSFAQYLDQHPVWFFGDGAAKCKNLITHLNSSFEETFSASAKYMTSTAFNKFQASQFEDVAYFEPFYLKDFIPGIPKVKGLD